MPYLDTGIVDILTRYLGGVGVILEHRYYGESIATQNLTTDSLRFVRSINFRGMLTGLIISIERFLNNAQAFADSANFMAKVKFDGISEDLTAPNTPWIYYGVSGA